MDAVSADYSTNWQYAFDGPLGRCFFKSHPEDFIVDELLPFEPEGEGEHLYLLLEKKRGKYRLGGGVAGATR